MPVSYLTADAVRAAERATGELLTNGTLTVSYTHLTLPTSDLV